MRFLILLPAFLLIRVVISQPIEHQVLPIDTDTAINGSADPHVCYVDPGAMPRNELLLFFPGTTASGTDYNLFLIEAAKLGYHVIGLDYENEASINLDVCPATKDTTCHGRARYEVWFGTDAHDSIEVTPANAILNRLPKLLLYLAATYPGENWGQFLEADSSIRWHLVCAAGHSQGGGHATFCAKQFAIKRVIMISWTDWMWPGRTAGWITQPGYTPDSAFYGFIHTGDASIYSGIPTTWSNLGIDQFGNQVLVDTSHFPYQFSHTLITAAAIDTTPVQTNFHNATCVDWVTPIHSQTGLPVFLPVWHYLLGASDFSSLEQRHEPSPVAAWVPLGNDRWQVQLRPGQPAVEWVKIIDMTGKSVDIQAIDNTFSLAMLPAGLYAVLVNIGNSWHSTKIVK